MNIAAIIPARGGSKGIKRKNLVNLNGKPLIAHSIEQALSSKLIDRVIVSTEDEEIMNISKQYGAEVPFTRPEELAEDHVLDLPVFEHALQYLTSIDKYEPEIIVHLRPTAPYRKIQWIDEAIDLLIKSNHSDSVRSVSSPNQHPYRVFTINNEGYLDPVMKHLHPTPFLLRRQDLPPMYYYNCVIDITKPSTIINKKSMTGDKILPYIIPSDEAIDIDSYRDLDIAKLFFENKYGV